jgi:hypothetical protein
VGQASLPRRARVRRARLGRVPLGGRRPDLGADRVADPRAGGGVGADRCRFWTERPFPRVRDNK